MTQRVEPDISGATEPFADQSDSAVAALRRALEEHDDRSIIQAWSSAALLPPLTDDRRAEILQRLITEVNAEDTHPNESPTTTQLPTPADARLPVYKATLRIISGLLLRTDWRKLKTSPYIIESAIKGLRDTIRYLEDLREAQVAGSDQIEQILAPTYIALLTLYKALDLGAAENQTGPFFEQIAQGRNYLQKAIYAFPREPQEAATT